MTYSFYPQRGGSQTVKRDERSEDYSAIKKPVGIAGSTSEKEGRFDAFLC